MSYLQRLKNSRSTNSHFRSHLTNVFPKLFLTADRSPRYCPARWGISAKPQVRGSPASHSIPDPPPNEISGGAFEMCGEIRDECVTPPGTNTIFPCFPFVIQFQSKTVVHTSTGWHDVTHF